MCVYGSISLNEVTTGLDWSEDMPIKSGTVGDAAARRDRVTELVGSYMYIGAGGLLVLAHFRQGRAHRTDVATFGQAAEAAYCVAPSKLLSARSALNLHSTSKKSFCY